MKNVSETVMKPERPVKILQFGEGNFLRAFVDWIVDLLNEKGDFNGDVMMIQPLKNGMGDMINAQNGVYTTVLRGVQNGKPVEEFRTITSVKGCINPFTQYDEYMKQAENPDLRFISSSILALSRALPDPEPPFRASIGRLSQSSCRFPTRVSTVALRYMQRVFSLIASAHSGVVTVPPPSEMMTVS